MSDMLKSIISGYLSSKNETRALFINGRWGVGKTHFIKKFIEGLEKGEESCIYLSLNGLKNSNELVTSVIKKGLFGKRENLEKISTGGIKTLGKALPNSISKFIVGLELQDFFEIKPGTILFFDDLERKSDEFAIKDLLGTINSFFIESKASAKVIIIGDETQIDAKKESFPTIKEKYFTWTVDFPKETGGAIGQIIDSYKTDEEYKSFLKNNRLFIIDICDSMDINNLRTVQFAFQCLERIHPIAKEFEELIKGIIYYVLIISNEYKLGIGKENSREVIEKYLLHNSIISFQDKGPQLLKEGTIDAIDEKEIDKNRLKKYFNSSIFGKHQFESVKASSIIDLVLTGYFSDEKMREEFQTLWGNLQRKKKSEDYQLIEAIRDGVLRSTQELFDQNYIKLKKRIEAGQLTIDTFTFAFEILLTLSKGGWTLDNRDELIKFFKLHVEKIRNKSPELQITSNKRNIDWIFRTVKKEDDELGKKLKAFYLEEVKRQHKQTAEKAFTENGLFFEDSSKFRDSIYHLDHEKIIEYLFDPEEEFKTKLNEFRLALVKGYNLQRGDLERYYPGYLDSLKSLKEKFLINEQKFASDRIGKKLFDYFIEDLDAVIEENEGKY